MIIWKDIIGFEGYYQVSNKGQIKSLERKVRKKYGFRAVRERILLNNKDDEGYCLVSLSKNNKIKKYRVHRIVAEHFIENPENLPQVNHKDENKDNNASDNLEWIVNLKNTNNFHSKNGTKKYGIHKSKSKWRARIKDKNNKFINLGTFVDSEEAYIAFFNKYIELHGIKPW